MATAESTRAMTSCPLELHAGHVLRLDRQAAVAGLRVVDGAVWATTTPADGDIVLQAGDALADLQHVPIVIQALADTVLTVTVPELSSLSLARPAVSPSIR